ncbi:hypothetical protein [Nocardioides sp. BYT-33-1]|uniref:hypothetical protein n=1 Tax=Nocardioides sp. BYT-33-1 TaxID=3416952 RepID=UPI003F53C063
MMLLENSDESEVNPDVAVAGLESIAAELQRMDATDLADFVSRVARLAADEEDPARRAFFNNVPLMLGLMT